MNKIGAAQIGTNHQMDVENGGQIMYVTGREIGILERTGSPLASWPIVVLSLTISLSYGSQSLAQDRLCWELRSLTGPEARLQAGMVFDSHRNRCVLFGGEVMANGLKSDETWEWNGAEWNLRAASGPPARFAHAMAFDSTRGVTVLFGGYDGVRFGDTWEWDGSEWRLASTTGPSPRTSRSMSFDSIRNVAVLVGGHDGVRDLSDTWEWDGIEWTLRSEVGPTAEQGAPIAFDANRGVSVLYTRQFATSTSQTWEWDGISWSLVATDRPTWRAAPTLIYDSLRRVCVLFGGHQGGEEVWDWNGSVWCQRPISGPQPSVRVNHSAAFDSTRSVGVLFGGHPGTPRDTWELDSLVIIRPPRGQAVTVGDTFSLSVEALGQGPLTYRWRKDGDNLFNNQRISGVRTPELRVERAKLFDDGLYDVLVSNGCGEVPSDPVRVTVEGMIGDLNCDGEINALDIEGFILALFTPSQYEQHYPRCDWMLADINQDGFVDSLDIQPFLELLFP